MPHVPGSKMTEDDLRRLRTSLFGWTDEDLMLVMGALSEQLMHRWNVSPIEATSRIVAILDLTGADSANEQASRN
jgi:hypothetical protein